MIRLGAILLALSALWLSLPAAAHDARPVSVLVRELPGDRYALRVRTPESVALDNLPSLVPPQGCTPVAIGNDPETLTVSEAVVACEGGIEGKRFDIVYPIYNPSLSTLFRLERLEGAPLSALLPPSDSSWTVPTEPGLFAVMGDYFRLGMEHIGGGFDHLLFVAGLLVIAGTWRRAVVALTGFTVAHSITLALAALDLVRLAAPPVEAAIALSILFLAVEIVRGRRESLAWRHPALVASLFGLLHGFGFAGVLREIGVPQSEIAAALLSFNLGVEAGQVAFVAALIALFVLGKRLARRRGQAVPEQGLPRGAAMLTAYAMGTVATFWLFERVTAFA